jgi:U3 small nucleolar RNA-associated protein 14
MAFQFNSKFQDTAGKRNQLYNSVSNIFELSDKDGKVNLNTEESEGGLRRQDTKAIVQQIEVDALRFHDNKGTNKIKFYCKFF